MASTLPCRAKSPSLKDEVAEARAYAMAATSAGSLFSFHLVLPCDDEPAPDLQHRKSIMRWGRGKKLLRRSLRASLRRWHLRRDLKDEEEGHARRGDQIRKGEQTPSGFTLFPHLDLLPTLPQTNRKLEGRSVRSTQGHSGVQWILLVISRCVTNYSSGTPLAVQWLRLCTSTSGGTGSVPGCGTRILHASLCGQDFYL